MGMGTFCEMQPSQLETLPGGEPRVQQQQATGVGHLCRYTCLSPTYPTPQVLNIAAKPWAPDFHPTASEVMQTQVFHVVALIRLADHFQS